MEHHFRILGAFINLTAGFGLLIYLLSLKRKYKSHILSHMITYSMGFNLLLLTYLILKYLDVNLPEVPGMVIEKRSAFMTLGGAWYGMILYSVFRIWNSMQKKNYVTYINIWFGLLAIVAIGGNVIYLTGNSISDFQGQYAYIILVTVTVSFKIFLLILSCIKSRKISDRNDRNMRTGFSIFFLTPYSILFLMILYLLFSGERSKALFAFASFAIFFTFNTAPYLWLKNSLLKYLNLNYQTKSVNDYSKVMNGFELSPREQEVCALILKGKDNREIEGELYISYNTVKNHVSSIYRKTGAGNRTQLVSLFLSLTKNY